MMTLVGTVIYVREGSGKDTVTRAIPIAGQDLVGFLFGRPDTQVLESEAFRLRCVEEDGDDRCLTVKKTTLDEVNLPYEFMKAASNYRNSILHRDPNLVSEADMLLLASVFYYSLNSSDQCHRFSSLLRLLSGHRAHLCRSRRF